METRVSDKTLAEMLEAAEQKWCFDDPLIAALKELQELRSQSRWVKVSERLPEIGRWIMCECSSGLTVPHFVGNPEMIGPQVKRWLYCPAAPKEGENNGQ